MDEWLINETIKVGNKKIYVYVAIWCHSFDSEWKTFLIFYINQKNRFPIFF